MMNFLKHLMKYLQSMCNVFFMHSIISSSLSLSLSPSLPLSYRKVSQGQISIPAYSYPAGFLPAMEHGSLRPATAYPFMIPGPYVAATPYQHQVNTMNIWFLERQAFIKGTLDPSPCMVSAIYVRRYMEEVMEALLWIDP